MNEHSGKLLPHIEVDLALREHATILANLLELHAHDFSKFHSLDLDLMADSVTSLFRCIGANLTDIRSLSLALLVR
jgi:hypothetical protein